ncbi:MAG: polysaccharide biosynthesis/export family protein [Flavobacteriaceae bacterium]|nr:polysaccharide biosynthesis/export family protein [Flavobacteriaceae bacterium]
MRKIFILTSLLITVLFSSCIPNKELVYFQGEPIQKNTVYKMANEPYKLQVNDILDIQIKADDEKLVEVFNSRVTSGTQTANFYNPETLYFTSYSVDRNGNIDMPYIGNINVLGYTEKEVQEKVKNELMKFFKDASGIFVKVKLAGIRFTVLGEVGSPGSKVLYQNQVSIVEALANSGDITMTGNRKNVNIIRKGTDKTEKFTIDLTDAAALDSELYYIQPNDIVYVAPLKEKSWGTGTTGVQTFTTIISVISFISTTILLIKNI